MSCKDDAKTDCGAGLRNRFFPKKRMLARDFDIEQRYSIGRRRLVNAAVLGHGVVYGLSVPHPAEEIDRPTTTEAPPTGQEADPPTQSDAPRASETRMEPIPLVVRAGFALDAAGHEILFEEDATLGIENTAVFVESSGKWCLRKIEKLKPGCYMLAVHYAERGAGETVTDWCGCSEPERTHLCEGVIFSLRLLKDSRCEDDCCACGEPACPGGGECASDKCENENHRAHAKLVEWASTRPAPDSAAPCELKDMCLHVGLPGVHLACVRIIEGPGECEPIKVDWVDDSSPKRVVKTNDSLYDLIRGCDLTRIIDVSWKHWVEEVALNDFTTFLEPPAGSDPAHKTGFRVEFSRPVKVEALKRRPDIVGFTFLKTDRSGWFDPLRLPILALIPEAEENGMTRAFNIGVESGWITEEVKARDSALSGGRFAIEIEIRCDLIEDCVGVPVDGNARGMALVPSGNGTPGGTHFSCFRVAAK